MRVSEMRRDPMRLTLKVEGAATSEERKGGRCFHKPGRRETDFPPGASRRKPPCNTWVLASETRTNLSSWSH